MNKYEESNSFGDNDLDKEYQGREIAINLLRISNELAESNRLKILELKHTVCGVRVLESEIDSKNGTYDEYET